MKRYNLSEIFKNAHRNYKYSGKKQGKTFGECLKSFTECSQYRAECYRLKAENEKLKIELSNSLKVSRSSRNQVEHFDYAGRMGAN